ncbi:MAG: thioesterase family protein [Myxococcales bacterium]|nr:thioesterase family protein [Myxococcota bacterium]MDW8280927.1 thioesterase family protein [Myxococcales bacterium]
MSMSEPADLAADTAVQPLSDAPGRYTAHLPEAWNYLTPSGGVLMTVALRAMQAEVPQLRPVSATALFCSPVPAGPLDIRVKVLRHGRVAAQLRAHLASSRAPGPGLEVSATFARQLEGPCGTFVAMPADIAPPAASRVPPDEQRPWRPNFLRNFDWRVGLGYVQGEQWAPAAPRHARWYRYRVPQRLADGRLDPLCIPPIADTMPAALAMALGSERRFYAPSLDLTVHFLADTTHEWLCAHSTCRAARSGYATADVEIWDNTGHLVAFGTQMMLLKAPRAG